VWRQDDRDIGSRGREAASELLQPVARPLREVTLIGRAVLGDGDPAVRGDRSEDERH